MKPPYCSDEHYKLCWDIANLIYSYSSPQSSSSNKPWMQRNIYAMPDSSCGGRMEDGFLLEFGYGVPSCLWTPWGVWHFVAYSGGDWRSVAPDILRRLGAKRWHPKVTKENGVPLGPWYGLWEIDGTALPEPILERQSLDYTQAKEMKQFLRQRQVGAEAK